jgi:hypothetical protein
MTPSTTSPGNTPPPHDTRDIGPVGVTVTRRVLTTAELDAILDAVAAASSTADTVCRALTGVYDALLADLGLSLADVTADNRIDPRAHAIPTAQWSAIVDAVTERAAEWGTGAELGLALVDRMPSHYPHPAVTVTPRLRTDRRPPLHTLDVTKEAVDVIAACDSHIRRLADFYGPASPIHLDALTSWHSHLARLFSMGLGAYTTISRDGDLSLFVSSASGLVFGLIFHGARRRCTDPDCGAFLADDGTATGHTSGASVREHPHLASYPLDGPRPGTWAFHS